MSNGIYDSDMNDFQGYMFGGRATLPRGQRIVHWAKDAAPHNCTDETKHQAYQRLTGQPLTGSGDRPAYETRDKELAGYLLPNGWYWENSPAGEAIVEYRT